MRASFIAFVGFTGLSLLLGAAGCGDEGSIPKGAKAPLLPSLAKATKGIASIEPNGPKKPAYPPAERRTVTTSFFGTEAKDDYAWLEDAKDPKVTSFVDAQNALTRSTLDGFAGRREVESRIGELLGREARSYSSLRKSKAGYFVLVNEPPKQQPFVVLLSGLDEKAQKRTLVDPNVLDPSGKTTIDWFVPSPDGKWIAVSLSVGGSESGDVHVFDVKTGKEKGDVVTRVHGGTAGGSLAWNERASGFFYTRYPRPGERPEKDADFYQQVYFHELGKDPKTDAYAIGKEFPRIAEVELSSSDDGKWILAEVSNGDGGEVEHHVWDGKGWKRLSSFADKWAHASFGADGALWVLSHEGAPKGKLVSIERPYDPKRAKTIVPEGEGVIERFEVTKDALYVAELVGGPSRLRALPRDGKGKGEELEILPVSAVGELVRDGDDLVFKNESYLLPPSYFRYVRKDKKVTPTAVSAPPVIDMSDVEVVRETCTSKDGTKIPLNVLRKKGLVLDKSRPTLLTGYGGYNVSRTPRLRPLTRLWLDHGGVFAEANLRGGGELGEAWHLAGNLTRKQNVFDDFHACAVHLVDAGYTRSDKLAAMGGSNGGLLMGASVVQHPETFRAVVSRVGIYDMLRVETTPNGAFNVTEYGTVKKEDQFRALYAYSPFHNVKDGTAYPAVLFTTGANDPRVDPFHSRKMTARLQAATSSDRPILLRASNDTGHGMGTPLAAEIAESTDIYTFLLHELGELGQTKAPKPPSAK